jgi:IPT/TIG domain
MGSTIAFVQSFTGPGALFFDTGNGPLGDPTYSGCPSVFETEGTTPPLDTFRRASVGLSITQLAIPAPTISSFSPTVGPIGTSVAITGTNFTGSGFTTSSVRFNGLSSTFMVNSATQIIATVPTGATTGPISVTTPGGTATSSTDFTVQTPVDQTPVDKHRSNVTLKLSGHLLATGQVNVPDGTNACERSRLVKIQKRKSGDWRTIRKDRTGATGTYKAGLPDGEGTYRSVVKKKKLDIDDVCLGDTSPRRTHNHPDDTGGGGGEGGGTGGNCDPSYPGVCIPPPPPDLDCDDVSANNFRVVSPDPHNFDGDNDGIGCET